MKSTPDKGPWRWIALAVALSFLVLWLVGDNPSIGAASSLSSSATGWSALRHYVEAKGLPVEVVDRPLSSIESGGTWVLTFPWSSPMGEDDLRAIQDHLRGRGHVLVAYSGDKGRVSERLMLLELGLDWQRLRDAPPLVPWEWRTYRQQRWQLDPHDESERRPELAAFHWAPEAPREAEVLYRGGDDDRPLVFEVPHLRGRVLLVPAALLANGALREGDNLELLEELMARLPGPWRFDEFHHGWQRPGDTPTSEATQAWDMFVLHLLVIYGLAVLALVRRFGPAWRPAPVVSGSALDFLRGVGSLHHRLKHYGAAGRWMLERAKTLYPHGDWHEMDGDVQDGPGLVALGQEISRRQRRRLP